MFNCNTCYLTCTTIEEIKEHYRTDLHVFNTKRRSKNLKPVSDEEFIRVVVNSNKSLVSSSSSLKTNAVAKSIISPPVPNQNIFLQRTFNSNNDKERQDMIASMTITSSKIQNKNETLDDSIFVDDIAKDDEDGEMEDDSEMIIDKQRQALPIGPNISIFDNKTFETTEECLQSMVLSNGFFIPDSEYISDLEGLLLYCSEKVKLGGTCLYCQKRFRSGIACQHHMVQKSHCKLAYEENVVRSTLSKYSVPLLLNQT